ncbi:helix-turn-helix domain-containing protein [Serratia sp. UGAL515B_01]|uniref:winged helix-turn-helix domain-containing protein n=1 Tax=Serratia sp. UGAL515B_01 TaxID=2986763 RepID=UPI002953416C|nr:helix-turn-helix domain-containing protein [Serratia sp. UGAL515B_01]WON75786.1 helix-turn-helix domain-containing protein [Serratia sp. UGAL515B_01]
MEINPVFARRLYLCWLISHCERPNVPHLMELTGWPRRTLQDVLKALPGLGVELQFVQQGIRNNAGYYQLANWGPLNRSWIDQHHQYLCAAIG